MSYHTLSTGKSCRISSLVLGLQALEAWPALKAKKPGLLGSPATAGHANLPGSWMDRFMNALGKFQALALQPSAGKEQHQILHCLLGSDMAAGRMHGTFKFIMIVLVHRKAKVDHADPRPPRVDFICLHWYTLPGADLTSATMRGAGELAQYCRSCHHMYGNKPVWVTEFALSDYADGPVKCAPFAECSVDR